VVATSWEMSSSWCPRRPGARVVTSWMYHPLPSGSENEANEM
jgi:hypothetical protein